MRQLLETSKVVRMLVKELLRIDSFLNTWGFFTIQPEAQLVMPVFCTIGYCLERLDRKNKALVSDLLSLKAFILITLTICNKI